MSPKKGATAATGSAKEATPEPEQVPEQVPEQPAVELACIKCGSNLEKDTTPRYCKPCRASYQRDYTALQQQMAANRGYEMGIKTFRAMMAAEFARNGRVAFSGAEVAFAILNAPRPAWPVETT